MLELAILGLLEDRAMHGYEIRKCLRHELGQVSNVSFGSLYPALSRLERSGAVVATEDEVGAVPSVPMTGSLSGERAAHRTRRSGPSLGRRSRKVYRITEEGRRQFARLLDSEPAAASDDARSFGLRLAFARYLPPQARLRLLERRRVHLVQRLLDTQSALAGAEGRLDTYTRSLLEHTTETTERDIAWLDRLIGAEHERAGEAAATQAAPLAARPGRTPQTAGAARRTPRRTTQHEGEAT